MSYTLTSGYLNNSVILFVFAIIVLILGIYVLYLVRQMKKTTTPPTFIISEKDQASIKDPEGYCRDARPKLIGIGIVCILYGIYEMFESMFLGIYMAKVVGAIALFIFIILFFVRLSGVRTKYSS